MIGVPFLDLLHFLLAIRSLVAVFVLRMSSLIPTETPRKWASLKVVLQFTVNVSLFDHPNAGSAFGGHEDDLDV